MFNKTESKTNGFTSPSTAPAPKKIIYQSPLAAPAPKKFVYQSPPPAIPTIEPISEGRIAFHYNDPNAKKGFTPNGKNVMPLQGRQGASHTYTRSIPKPFIGESYFLNNQYGPYPLSSPILRSSSLLCAPIIMDFDTAVNIFYSSMVDLRNRSNQDYEIKLKSGAVEENHFRFAKGLTITCIEQFELCLSKAKSTAEKTQFIDKINRKIIDGIFYNPYQMKIIYDTNKFDLALAKDPSIYAAPIENPFINPVSTKRKFENTSSSSTALSSARLFIPRNVRIGKNLNDSPATTTEENSESQGSSKESQFSTSP